MLPTNDTPARQRALITGATSGIGLDLAEIFARNHHNLLLVARRAAELQVLADRFGNEYGVEVQTIEIDLSESDAADRVVVEAQSRGKLVDILVNNAGYAQYGKFIETDGEAELRMIQLNVLTPTRLAKLLLPGMVERRRGKVLNTASTAAFMPGPLMSVYYATKAYVLSWSEALNEELRGTGVTVTALCPGPTATGFQARAQMQGSKLLRSNVMDSATVARLGYEGLMEGKPVVIPGTINKLQALAPRFVPRRLVPGLVRRSQEQVGH